MKLLETITQILTDVLQKNNLSYKEFKEGEVDDRHRKVARELQKYEFTSDTYLERFNIVKLNRMWYIRRYKPKTKEK